MSVLIQGWEALKGSGEAVCPNDSHQSNEIITKKIGNLRKKFNPTIFQVISLKVHFSYWNSVENWLRCNKRITLITNNNLNSFQANFKLFFPVSNQNLPGQNTLIKVFNKQWYQRFRSEKTLSMSSRRNSFCLTALFIAINSIIDDKFKSIFTENKNHSIYFWK